MSISSSAGLAAGFEVVTAYAASTFGLEGWMESLQMEVAPFGVATTLDRLRLRASGATRVSFQPRLSATPTLTVVATAGVSGHDTSAASAF